MIGLQAGDWTASILDAQGAALGSLRHAGRDIVAPVPADGHPNIGMHSAFLMAPWTNRLDGGRISVGGVDYRMPINRPLEGNALHGFIREQAWKIEAQATDRAVLSCFVDHPPFRCGAWLEVSLAPRGLTLSLALTNTGAAPTPMGIGWHPFFTRPAGTRVDFRAGTVFGRDPRGLAVAPRPSSGLQGDEAVLLGLDTHFAGWDGVALMARPDCPVLTLRATGDWARNIQVFAPRIADVLCLEPVSHVPDVVNRPDLARFGPMRVLAPSQALQGTASLHLPEGSG